jgi:hypothetical protein
LRKRRFAGTVARRSAGFFRSALFTVMGGARKSRCCQIAAIVRAGAVLD